ncbi:MAG TPA: lipid-binding SYLF domain-containing protein [Kiloniellales bacterium]|jgi:lipid-binding SYLF domain-containing protein
MTRIFSLLPDWHLGFLLAVTASIALVAAAPRPAAADVTAEELVEESRFTVERMMNDKEMPEARQVVEKARGVLIIPELVKGGFIIGAEGGSGLLMVRGSDGTWSSPAFYTLIAGSIGLQIGGQVAEVIFALMNDGAVEAFMANEFKLGGDVSIAVGPLGRGVEASTTTNLNKDIYAYSRAVGLFGGGSLEGAKILNRQDLNDAYYGAVAPAREIVLERKFVNRDADALRKSLP